MKSKQRTDSLETALMILALLERIPASPRKITSKELQEKLQAAGFDRDLRSVQRLLDSLSQHFDIERDDRSKPYGYSWNKDAKGFSWPGLNEQESLLLRLAEQHLRNLLPTRLMKSMDGFFKQAQDRLAPHGDAQLARQWLGKVQVISARQPLLPPEIRAGILDAVSNALYENKWLEVDYENQRSVRSKVRVMPLGLVQQEQCLYLVCRYDGYDNERHLALHRMHKATVEPWTFERPRFDLKKYGADGHFGFGEGKLVRLQFRIAKDAGFHLSESKLSKDQQFVEEDDCFAITATLVDSAMLQWWLNGFGDAVWDIHREPVTALSK
ncbi:helix-turn-helix transcriptional regulator [Lampropedia aestuarii]|uniref:helix-turn-helix transcriptional regulator n=1 Tax=Lampropedia aestuarii TaxID=2562762 RepID=UPI0024692623|nr:WYL domain-containing protein [Lampropedia aestuarii]MDH5859182.1 WYL domain-containing protein [Lampropedia aestuarii]